MAAPRSATVPDYPRSQYDGVRMSLAEYEELPEEKPYLEYWDGVVLQKAVPRFDHRRIAKRLVVAFDQYEQLAGGDSGPEGHVWFEGRGWLVPDVTYWAPDRVILDDRRRQLPPTLAVEVRSEGQQLSRLTRKCRDMRANGVDVCWLIDPQGRRAYVFEGDRDNEELPSDAVLTSAWLPGFELPLSRLWAELDR